LRLFAFYFLDSSVFDSKGNDSAAYLTIGLIHPPQETDPASTIDKLERLEPSQRVEHRAG